MNNKTAEEYKRAIVRSMKACNVYSPHLNIHIESLAILKYTLDRCYEVISEPDFSPVSVKVTRDGEQEVEHPVIKSIDKLTSDIRREMAALKLTVSDIVGTPDVPDAGDAVIEATIKAGKK